MKTRLLSAAILLPVCFLIIWALPKAVCAVAIAALCALMAYELLYRTGVVRHTRMIVYTMIAAFLVPIWSHLGMNDTIGQLGQLLFFCAIFGEMLYNHVKIRFEMIGFCLLAGIVIPYFMAAIVRILDLYTGRDLIIIPLILAFLPDSGAYFIGIRYGKRKLAPTVSPKKSVEGALGGLAVAVIGMLVYAVVMDIATDREVSYSLALVYAVLGAAADVFGDLIFSAIKRQMGIKDYGNVIPGRGGALDRFDSMIVVAPLTEILISLIPMV
jgi:phosphatidate cytidylyltransferase